MIATAPEEVRSSRVSVRSSWVRPGEPVDESLGSRDRPFGVDLYWLPLGAAGYVVRLNGRLYEAVKACLGRRPSRDLYHSGLEVVVPSGRYVIEMTPIPNARSADRGVVAEGPVGAAWAGRFRIFRYEVRCWRDGVIPDVAEALDSPRRLAGDPETATRVLSLTPKVPTLVWGRDEAKTGEMWNSNSMISWILDRAGLDAAAIQAPEGGRALGWDAGIAVATRSRHGEPLVAGCGR